MADPHVNESLLSGALLGGTGTLGVLIGTFFNALKNQLSAQGKQDSGVNKNLIEENTRLIAENKRLVDERVAAQAREDGTRAKLDEQRLQIEKLYDDMDEVRSDLQLTEQMAAHRLRTRDEARARVAQLEQQAGLPLTVYLPDPVVTFLRDRKESDDHH